MQMTSWFFWGFVFCLFGAGWATGYLTALWVARRERLMIRDELQDITADLTGCLEGGLINESVMNEIMDVPTAGGPTVTEYGLLTMVAPYKGWDIERLDPEVAHQVSHPDQDPADG